MSPSGSGIFAIECETTIIPGREAQTAVAIRHGISIDWLAPVPVEKTATSRDGLRRNFRRVQPVICL